MKLDYFHIILICINPDITLVLFKHVPYHQYIGDLLFLSYSHIFPEIYVNKSFNISNLFLSALLLSIGSLCQAESGSNPQKAMPNMENSQGKIYGKVIETINAGGYTYVHVDTGKEKYWAATPTVTLKTGSMVAFVPNMKMNNYVSKTLDRKFDVVYFVGQIYTDKAGGHPAKADMHSKMDNTPAQPVAGIKKAANGKTINEVLSQKKELAGQTVHIRGKVVKYTPQVMGKNWVHIRDSSSSKDLTLTTADIAKKGDVILVSGKLQLNKDFGYGYTYEVLLEDSKITIE